MVRTHETGAAKLLLLLEALSEADSSLREGLTVVELSRALGRDKSIVSRQLRPLVDLGVVERTDVGRHRLGWRLFAIAARAGDQRLLLLAPPVMRRLTQLVRERVHLSVRRGSDVFTILSESPHRAVEAVEWVGRTAPVSCTSAGRAMLFDHADDEIRGLFNGQFEHGAGANSPRGVEDLLKRVTEARRFGYVTLTDEFDEDLTAIGAPVRNAHGQIVAALNISAPSYRLKENLGGAGRQVHNAALHLSRALSSPTETAD